MNHTPVKNVFLGCLMILSGIDATAQQTIPLLEANSKKIAIKDGDEGITKFWSHLEKTAKPVVYPLAKNQGVRKVVFYTDIDSFSFYAQPDSSYPINVAINGKDTIYAILSTKNHRLSFKNAVEKIPFKLKDGKRIFVKASVNHSAPMDFMIDLGARYCFLMGKDVDVKNNVAIDGHIEDESLTGLATELMSSSNAIGLGNLTFLEAPICVIKEVEEEIGLIGSNAFESSILELDFENEHLCLHKTLPAYLSSYTKIPVRQTTGGLYVNLTLNVGKKTVNGWFFIDTGADNFLSLDSKFANRHELYGTMKKIGEVRGSSPGGDSSTVSADLLEIPSVSIGNYTFKLAPSVLAKVSHTEANFEDGVIGIGLLKRFNLAIDFPGNAMYLRPNALFDEAYTQKRNGNMAYIIIGGLMLCLIVYLYFKNSF